MPGRRSKVSEEGSGRCTTVPSRWSCLMPRMALPRDRWPVPAPPQSGSRLGTHPQFMACGSTLRLAKRRSKDGGTSASGASTRRRPGPGPGGTAEPLESVGAPGKRRCGDRPEFGRSHRLALVDQVRRRAARAATSAVQVADCARAPTTSDVRLCVVVASSALATLGGRSLEPKTTDPRSRVATPAGSNMGSAREVVVSHCSLAGRDDVGGPRSNAGPSRRHHCAFLTDRG